MSALQDALNDYTELVHRSSNHFSVARQEKALAAGQEYAAMRSQLAAQDARIAALEAALKHIQDMANDDIRNGSTGKLTWQIEADARAAAALGRERER